MGEPRSWGEFMEALVKLIGQAADTGGSQTAGTVFGKENAILGILKNGGMPIVKSIQSGIAQNIPISNATFTISEVNVEKIVIFLQGGVQGNFYPIWVENVTPTSFNVKSYNCGSAKFYFGWYVVEFY